MTRLVPERLELLYDLLDDLTAEPLSLAPLGAP